MQFINEFTPILDKLSKLKSEVIIAGDFNIDLLKNYDKPVFSEYFDLISALGFFPKIILPTRFADRRGALIDNFLYKWSHSTSQTTAGILISRISDHLPYFISMDNLIVKQTKTHKMIQI